MKTMFTQGFVVLLDRPVGIEELRSSLPEFPFLQVVPADSEWAYSGESAAVSFRPEVNGLVAIDTVNHVWPDHMGSSKEELTLFTAWGTGHFGPFAYPGGLQRAMAQAWWWPAAKERVPTHCGFIRLRLSYCFGAGPDTPVKPQECDPRAELDFLTDMVRGVLRHPAAICYFNPNGEVVAPAAVVDEQIKFHREHNLPPFNVWSNVRLFNMPGNWSMVDSVGNGQLDIPDQEVAFPRGTFEVQDIDGFIRNASLYLLTKGLVIKDGETMNGPGGKLWRATTFKNALNDPPREVLCWVPADARNLPSFFSNRAKKNEGDPKEKRSWWKR